MTNLSELLERVGSGLERVVDMKIYLADIEHLDDISDVMDEFFGQNKPVCSNCLEKVHGTAKLTCRLTPPAGQESLGKEPL
jgi:enamine deaminase RidA (YjgF/YER057c/UK114 family)